LLLFGGVFASTVIKLKKKVFLDKEEIYLSDISTVYSDNPSVKELLEGLYISDFPKSASHRRITREEVISIVKSHYSEGFHVEGQECIVERAPLTVSQESIKDEIRNFLKKKYPDVEIISISVPRIRPVKGKNLKTVIKESSKTSSYIYLNYFIYKNGSLLRRISVPVKYRKISYVVFSKTDIKKGEYITKNKVHLKRYTGNTRHMFSSFEEVIGKKAKINIKAGIPIKDYMVVPDYLVLRGSNVKIIYNKGVIHIELIGRALENGQLNQIIKVKNISSGKVIPCKVIGRNQVLFIGGSF
jgi:flagella basal body P-ring formation protein FlgA